MTETKLEVAGTKNIVFEITWVKLVVGLVSLAVILGGYVTQIAVQTAHAQAYETVQTQITTFLSTASEDVFVHNDVPEVTKNYIMTNTVSATQFGDFCTKVMCRLDTIESKLRN